MSDRQLRLPPRTKLSESMKRVCSQASERSRNKKSSVQSTEPSEESQRQVLANQTLEANDSSLTGLNWIGDLSSEDLSG